VELSLKHITNTEEECTKTLAKLSSLSVEQLLRIAEWCLNISEKKSFTSSQNFASSCHQICTLCDYFDQELTTVSTVYIDLLQKITKLVQDNLKGQLDSPNYQNKIKKISARSKTASNNMYIDVGNAISNIQDAKKLLLTIAKYCIITQQNPEDTTTIPTIPPTNQTSATNLTPTTHTTTGVPTTTTSPTTTTT